MPDNPMEPVEVGSVGAAVAGRRLGPAASSWEDAAASARVAGAPWAPRAASERGILEPHRAEGQDTPAGIVRRQVGHSCRQMS